MLIYVPSIRYEGASLQQTNIDRTSWLVVTLVFIPYPGKQKKTKNKAKQNERPRNESGSGSSVAILGETIVIRWSHLGLARSSDEALMTNESVAKWAQAASDWGPSFAFTCYRIAMLILSRSVDTRNAPGSACLVPIRHFSLPVAPTAKAAALGTWSFNGVCWGYPHDGMVDRLPKSAGLPKSMQLAQPPRPLYLLIPFIAN